MKQQTVRTRVFIGFRETQPVGLRCQLGYLQKEGQTVGLSYQLVIYRKSEELSFWHMTIYY